MMRVMECVVAAALLMTFSDAAKAGIIVDHAFSTAASNGSGPGYFNDHTTFTLWDDFQLSGDATVTSVSFLFGVGAIPPTYYFEIRNDAAGTLGAVVSSQTIAGIDVLRTSNFLPGVTRFDFSVSPTTLSAGHYWVSFSGPTLIAAASGTGGDGFIQRFYTGSTSIRGEGSGVIPFQLLDNSNGTVSTVTPEPTSLALAGFAGFGMAVGAWRGRRQQKSQAA